MLLFTDKREQSRDHTSDVLEVEEKGEFRKKRICWKTARIRCLENDKKHDLIKRGKRNAIADGREWRVGKIKKGKKKK